MTTKIVSEQDFKREPRYVVFKFKDVEQLSDEDRKALIRLSKSIEGVRASRGKTGFQAVIVESDWPEYETVWQMIEARMTNRVSGEVDENTAKRFRGILYMLGISAPESDEALMLCQFSLLGMVRHKIQQIYNQPDRTAQLEAKLETERQRLAACGVAALGYFEGCSPQYKSGSLEDVLRLRDSNKQLQADNKRLVEALKVVDGMFWVDRTTRLEIYESKHYPGEANWDKYELSSHISALLAEMDAKG